MKTDNMRAFAYIRLSREDKKSIESESASITNQRTIIQDFCKRNGITLVDEFVDDGWSGGNFERPAFKQMIIQLEKGIANTVIVKDLSRFGREMSEASDYAEQILPEMGVRLVTVVDNFDSEELNTYVPFMYAMNDAYLREGSKKIKTVLKSKREHGLYCACPPYGYKKDDTDKNRLVPDPETSDVVKRIFRAAANGDSSIEIALSLTSDGVITPSKYRAFYRDKFTPQGLEQVSDKWNKTTVKRILQNRVYLGHTILGKSQKISVKSKKKRAVPNDKWAITYNTHKPLVSEELFEKAKVNLAKGTKAAEKNMTTRNSIFRGIVYCKRCGHALCSGGTVYKDERDKYWYLTCTNNRKDARDRCTGGTRIKYSVLVDIVKNELNKLLVLSEEQLCEISNNLVNRMNQSNGVCSIPEQKQKARARLAVIDKMIKKAYNDNAEGRLTDDRLYNMVTELEKEASELEAKIDRLNSADHEKEIRANFAKFYELAKNYSHIEELTRDILTTFVERIEVDAKVLPEGVKMITHDNQTFEQEITIYFKFISNIDFESVAAS